jgi:hypothetical protein
MIAKFRVARCGPQPLSDRHGIDADGLPPGCFIAAIVQLSMMETAERNGELVADFAAQGTGLSGAEMMGICGLPAAHDAGLRGYERQVVLVPSSARLAVQQDGAPSVKIRNSFGSLYSASLWHVSIWQRDLGGRLVRLQLGFECFLDGASILSREGVLCRQAPVSPTQHLFLIQKAGDLTLQLRS